MPIEMNTSTECLSQTCSFLISGPKFAPKISSKQHSEEGRYKASQMYLACASCPLGRPMLQLQTMLCKKDKKMNPTKCNYNSVLLFTWTFMASFHMMCRHASYLGCVDPAHRLAALPVNQLLSLPYSG